MLQGWKWNLGSISTELFLKYPSRMLDPYYGLNGTSPPRFICWIPNPNVIIFGDRAVRRYVRLNESEGWGPNPIGLVALEEGEERKVSSQAGAQGRLCEHPEGGPLRAGKKALVGPRQCWHPDHRLPASRTVRKWMSVVQASQTMAFCLAVLGPCIFYSIHECI